jgi:hypothetical protein
LVGKLQRFLAFGLGFGSGKISERDRGVFPNGFRMRKDLMAHRGNVLVVAGQRQPIEVHLLAHAINSALGADWQHGDFDSGEGNSQAGFEKMLALVRVTRW